jgi:hypothetical protein
MPVNQPSEKQSAASRANGAKSKGPATPEGRARASRNSLRHGLSSENVVLPHEDRAHFEQHRESYIQSFQPANQPQHDLVETLAAARWRLTRLQHIETKLFEKEMVVRAQEMDNELEDMTEVDKLAWVFDRMANQGKSIALLIRYEGSLNRSYERAFKQLQQLQSRPQVPPSEPQQNEPEPAQPAAQLAPSKASPDPLPLPEPAPRSPETPEKSPAQPDPANRL